MNINYKQPQFELFPANSATLEDINKPKFLLANLTLSIESLVIFTILGIMVALFSFSLGVERGKHAAAQALDERVSAAWNVKARTVAVPAVAATAVATTAPATRPAQKAVVVQKPAKNYGIIQGSQAGHSQVQGNRARFTLQFATYGNEKYARKDAMILKAKGLSSFLIKSGKYWLVCIGNFNSKENAAGFLKKLPANLRASQVRRF